MIWFAIPFSKYLTTKIWIFFTSTLGYTRLWENLKFVERWTPNGVYRNRTERIWFWNRGSGTCYALVLRAEESFKQSLSLFILCQKRIAFKCPLDLHFHDIFPWYLSLIFFFFFFFFFTEKGVASSKTNFSQLVLAIGRFQWNLFWTEKFTFLSLILI